MYVFKNDSCIRKFFTVFDLIISMSNTISYAIYN